MQKLNLYEGKDKGVFYTKTFDDMKRVSTQCTMKTRIFVVL